jgi:hypothetical protein
VAIRAVKCLLEASPVRCQVCIGVYKSTTPAFVVIPSLPSVPDVALILDSQDQVEHYSPFLPDIFSVTQKIVVGEGVDSRPGISICCHRFGLIHQIHQIHQRHQTNFHWSVCMHLHPRQGATGFGTPAEMQEEIWEMTVTTGRQAADKRTACRKRLQLPFVLTKLPLRS